MLKFKRKYCNETDSRWFPNYSEDKESTSIYKNYGTCRSALKNYHLVPSTSTTRSMIELNQSLNSENLNRELQVKLGGGDILHNDSPNKNSRKVKKIETPTITKIV